jgi:hypothetical protein
MVRKQGETMSELRSHGEISLPTVPGEGRAEIVEVKKEEQDFLFQFGFQTTTQSIELMRSLAATGLDGAAKMSCVLAVVNDSLGKIAPQIPVPGWAKLAQAMVARIALATFGRIFAGVVEAIYQQSIRKPTAEP